MLMDYTGRGIGKDSHKLFLIRRTDQGDSASLTFVSPITDAVAMKLAVALRRRGEDEQIKLYRRFVGFPQGRAAAGTIYESICHRKFKTSIDIKYVPMIRLADADAPPPAKKMKTSEPSKKKQHQ
jgi:hypothetical protein